MSTMVKNKQIFCQFLVIIMACGMDYVRGDVCYYQETTQVKSSRSCGTFGWRRCTTYRPQTVTKSKCCYLWTGSNCDEVICGEPSISNGRAEIQITPDGILAAYSCDQDYQLTGGDDTRSCQSEGFWDGQEPSCAYMNSCSSNPCLNGGICSNDIGTYTCTCPLAWSGSRCEINVVDCGHPGDIERGTVSFSGTKYGSTATYTCREHYNMTDGDSVSTCQMDFNWSGEKPTCTFVNTCGSNPCQNSGTCVNGLNIYTCVCGPGWSGTNCEQDIQPPLLEQCPTNIHKNATKRTHFVSWREPVFTDPFGNSIDITANYPQAEFDFPWGDFVVQYLAVKVNNGLPAECTFNVSIRPTPCTDLNIPLNGARICNSWKTDYGRACIMACKQNFTIPPSQSLEKLYVCGASGQWIFPDPLPDCSVPLESEEEIKIYHPYSTSPSVLSCDDYEALGPVRQHYIDVLTQSGELVAYCHKYSEECHPHNVDITCN